MMFHRRLLPFILLLLVGLSGPALAQRGEEPVKATDLLELRRLGSVAVSPDGRQVAYAVESVVGDAGTDDSLASRSQLFLADANGTAEPRQLTRGEFGASHPTWHPDGNRLAFVRLVDGTPQLFILPLLGGEAYQVTRLESGATSPVWSPDGSAILFTSNLSEEEVRERTGSRPSWPDERPGRSEGAFEDAHPDPDGALPEIRAWLEENADDGNPRVFRRLDLQGEHDLEPTPEHRHFFVVEPDSGREPEMITSGFGDFSSADWFPDGQRLVVAGLHDPAAHPDRVQDSNLYVVGRDGSNFRTLADLQEVALFAPTVSPDGQLVAFLAENLDDPGYAQTELGVTPMHNPSDVRWVTGAFDRSVSDPRWSQDGWYVYFTAPSNGGFPMYRVRPFDVAPEPADAAAADPEAPDTTAADSAATAESPDSAATAGLAESPDSAATAGLAESAATPTSTRAAQTAPPEAAYPEIERLTSFERGVVSFDIGRATVFFVAHSVTSPFELYAANLPVSTERRLTSHNTSWVAEKRLSIPERHELTRDGRTIEYWIMKPAFFDSSRTYPLLVEIHGGPSAMWGPGESTMWHEFQFFAGKGYGIVFSNPRGSGGYGYDFKRANFQDWGAGPAGDVLAAASAAADLPWVDSTRQVVTGGSYAGYLTAWIIAHDARFRAAAAQRGVYDLDTFLGEGNAWRLIPSHFGGYPWNVTPDTVYGAEPPVVEAVPAETASANSESIRAEAVPAETASASADSIIAETAEADPAAASDSVEAAADADSLAVVSGAAAAARSDTALASSRRRLAPSHSEILDRNSPLTFVDRITTPLLIMHADRDLRTGVVQSEMLYKSLKILGRPVEYVRYPDAGHDLSRTGDPTQRLDRLLRLYEFFERFIGD